MSIWNKILIGFIFVASVAFFYMAARTLKTQQYWRELARAHERALDAKLKENRQLAGDAYEKGEKAKMGIRQVRLELHKQLIDRGRVWYNCTPHQPNKETGQVTVQTDRPDPNGIAVKTILCVFEEGDVENKSRYIGEFKVGAVNAKSVALEPSRKPGRRELERLGTSKGPWTLYEIMPIDNHEAFADLEEAKKKDMLPGDTLSEYLKDGQTADKNDPKECQDKSGKYVRALRDYAVLYRVYHLERSILNDLFECFQRDVQAMVDGTEHGKRVEESLTKEIAQLKLDLAKYQRERDAVVAHHKKVEASFASFRASVDEMIATNRKLASQLATVQAEALRRVDAKTGSMARAATAGN